MNQIERKIKELEKLIEKNTKWRRFEQFIFKLFLIAGSIYLLYYIIYSMLI